MKKMIFAMVLVGLFAGSAFAQSATISPVMVTNLSFLRSHVTKISDRVAAGETFVITNARCFSDASGVSTQSLSNVTVNVILYSDTIGTNLTNTATAINDSQWFTSFEMPDDSTIAKVQVRLTDENTNIYTYPEANIRIVDKL